ncbi:MULTISPECIES: aspartyl/glutamyl-tRNA amidotransferase subunit C [Terrabacteria group]|uniref:Asp-tRNA(Asn)/Glu-tRNA(Gln) amidotransferase subunit GatC n=1 Tax=Bacillati TaxID=1783272 RepID=UPI00193A379C|nr:MULTISPECIES: Asp-tRNA(Asn)/Glu-tRNA(Gln) amidotransferase GatCAB subunit C [Terrabacteria group]MBW9212851.1 hypothetical protein [Trueperella sp. zg.1013]QRG86456.1 Asp-tRNA(Asn)/Glu-tRNA(Gln) amidotransferase GatCAB subunit C [Bulleidia sp. zg-1006]
MSENRNRQYFKSLAEQLMFQLSDEEADGLSEDFKILDKQLALLDKIDTSHTEEMIYPLDVETSFLRKDEVTHVISQEEAVANVTKKVEGHFVLPKVVK